MELGASRISDAGKLLEALPPAVAQQPDDGLSSPAENLGQPKPPAQPPPDAPSFLGGGFSAHAGIPVRRINLPTRPLIPDNGRVLEMTRETFEELVAEALDTIPPELTRVMDNVAVFVEDEPPTDDPELLGLYEGTPLTDRGEWYAGVLPDRISIYMGPTLRYCASQEDVVHEVAVTVVHEIAHHFGIGDERLHELGWG